MTRRWSSWVAIAGMLATTATTASVGADDKVFSGAACQPFYGSNAPAIALTGGIVNYFGGTGVAITCPILRDNTINSNGLLDLDIWVYSDSGPNQGVNCSAYSYSKGQGLVDTAYASTTVAGYQRLDFAAGLNASIVSDATNFGMYEIHCTLHASETVVGYRWSEP